jgi:zona occludens toxin
MATSLFHGAPGSYKTSSAVWFVLLKALREGRFVVTNVEGLKPIYDIENALGVKFPSSAYLFRVSTLTTAGVDLLSRWFHWLPCGGLVLIDEIQNLYNAKERGDLERLNPSLDLNFKQRLDLLDTLPDDVKVITLDRLDSIENDGYTDDLGLAERDENGHIFYPASLKDALMRHRKYNWDVYACTPDISHVHSLFRAVAERAVSHKSFDFVPLPYFQRRPRTHEHNPLEKGIRPSKGEPIKRVKIPLDVFKLYKSTQTGKNNKSGANENPLKNRAFIFKVVFVLSLVFGLLAVYVASKVDSKTSVSSVSSEVSKISSSSSLSRGQVSADSNSSVVAGNDNLQKLGALPDYLAFLGVKTVYITAIVDTVHGSKSFSSNGRRGRFPNVVNKYYSFELITDSSVFYVDSDTLADYGYSIDSKSDCSVILKSDSFNYAAFCKPFEHVNDERFSNKVDFGDNILLGG